MPIPLHTYPDARPYTNVQPFTVRDGATYLLIQEGIREWIRDVLVPHLDTEVGGLAESWEANKLALQEIFDAIAADLVGSATAEAEAAALSAAAADASADLAQSYAATAGTLADAAMVSIFNNLASAFRVAANAAFASKATQTTVETGRLASGTLDTRFNAKADTTAVTTAIDAAIDAEETARDTAIGAEATARATAVALKRDKLSAVQAAGQSFLSLTDVGAYAFTAAPTHVTAPTSDPGLLLVEKNGTQIQQTYYAHGSATAEPEVFFQFIDNGSASGWRKLPGNPGFRPRGKITFIGDSYMAGLGLGSASTERWTALLAVQFGVPEQNLSNSGSGYINAGGAGNFVTQSASTATDADTVIISGGINDAPLSPSQGQITTAVNAIIANVRAAAPNARIVFISPMMYQNNPTEIVMQVDAKLRVAVAAAGPKIRYVENAMWLRVERDELAQGDGHPNAVGSVVIKNWVYDQLLNEPGPGAIQGKFVSPASGDATLNGPSTNMIADGTVYGARRGWYRIHGQVILYNSVLGFLVLKAGAYTEEQRDDVVSGGSPTSKHVEFDYYHGGGDLYIGVGYRPNASATTTLTGLRKNRVTAEWLHI